MHKNFLIGWSVAVAALGFDQLSKWWIVSDVMNPPQVIEVTSFFNLVLTFNRGISFGLFPAGSDMGRWVLVGIALLISVFIVFWMRKAENRLSAIALGLILGGAIGNVIDRSLLGAVIDFLDFHAAGYHWPAFNIADSAIFVGAATIILEPLFNRDKSA